MIPTIDRLYSFFDNWHKTSSELFYNHFHRIRFLNLPKTRIGMEGVVVRVIVMVWVMRNSENRLFSCCMVKLWPDPLRIREYTMWISYV